MYVYICVCVDVWHDLNQVTCCVENLYGHHDDLVLISALFLFPSVAIVMDPKTSRNSGLQDVTHRFLRTDQFRVCNLPAICLRR